MKSEFEILFVSESSYEFLIVEIHFNGQRLCQINKEKGDDELEIEFSNEFYLLDKLVKFNFSLSRFLQVLERASKELRECN